jgi:MFS family permease
MAGVTADFWRLWTAATVSSLGDGLRLAAMPLLAARLTQDPVMVALVAAAGGSAWLLVGLPAGALADRWDRRRIMVGCDAVRCALALALVGAVATGHASIALLMIVEFLLNATETLFYGAAEAAIPAVVGGSDLERANGRLQAATVLGAGFVGPPVGAALFVLAAALPFSVDAVSFGLASLLALGIRADLSPAAPSARRPLLREVADGLAWLWRHAELRTIMVLLVVWNLVESAILAVLVLWSLWTLQLPEAGYGLLWAALAAGGVAGSLLAERVGTVLGQGRAMTSSVTLTVAVYAGLGLTRQPLAAGTLMALLGVAAFVWNVITASFRQTVAPDGLRGRVSSAYRFATWGVSALGALLGGAVASRWGLQAPFLVAAVALGAAALVAMPRLTNVRLTAARAAASGG